MLVLALTQKAVNEPEYLIALTSCLVWSSGGNTFKYELFSQNLRDKHAADFIQDLSGSKCWKKKKKASLCVSVCKRTSASAKSQSSAVRFRRPFGTAWSCVYSVYNITSIA